MKQASHRNQTTSLRRLASAIDYGLFVTIERALRGDWRLIVTKTEGEIARGSRDFILRLVHDRGLRLATGEHVAYGPDGKARLVYVPGSAQ